MPPPRWRPMLETDLEPVVAIAAVVHPGFYEAPDVLAEKHRLHPAGARVLAGAEGVVGYVLSHPWLFADVPALNTPLGHLPTGADTYYLHDLALLPATRGTGAAGAVVTELAEHALAAGFATMSLVAVNGSQGFWRRQGFGVVENPTLATALQGYEGHARYMLRRLV